MTKELSRQICKLCGVEPWYRCWMINGAVRFKRKQDTKGYHHIDSEPFFPDLGEPVNFVRLWELKFENPETRQLMGINIWFSRLSDNRQDYLEHLAYQLNPELNTHYQHYKNSLDAIKQAIKSGNWEV